MKLLLIVLLALLVALGGVLLSAHSTGYVVITVAGWSLQTSVVVFLLIIIILYLLLYLSLRVVAGLLGGAEHWLHWRRSRRQRLAGKLLIDGLLALIEGRMGSAEETLVKGARYSSSPLVNYLYAARAAYRRGRRSQGDQYLEQVRASTAEESIALALTRAELLLEQDRADAALAVLNTVYADHPRHPRIRLLLLRTRVRLGAWREALRLLPAISRDGLLTPAEIELELTGAYAGLLHQAGAAASSNWLDEVWREIPRKLRRHPSLIKAYTRERLKFPDTSVCEPLLQKAITNARDAELVSLYGLVAGSEPDRQLSYAEGLTAVYPDDAWVWLTHGRLCLRHSLWGKARASLQRSLDLQPLVETYRELARLHEQQGEYAAASGYYQQGLALAIAPGGHESARLREQSEQAEAMTAGARQVY